MKDVEVAYKGDQENTSLAFSGKRIHNISPGDKVEVPSDVADELVEQGNYEFASKAKSKSKKVEEED